MSGIKGRGGQKGRSGNRSAYPRGRNGGRPTSSTEGLGRQISNLFEVLVQKYPDATLQAESIRVFRCSCGAISWSDWEIDAYRDGRLVGVEHVTGFTARHSEDCNSRTPAA